MEHLLTILGTFAGLIGFALIGLSRDNSDSRMVGAGVVITLLATAMIGYAVTKIESRPLNFEIICNHGEHNGEGIIKQRQN
jgi:MFS-type transporter involved in bile tolerance (Atg22 family)